MILPIVSAVSGAIGGMGIGGGIILIPVLTSFFDIGQKSAQFINLIYFVPLSLCALFVHIKGGRVEFKKVLPMALGGVPGALVGAWVASAVGITFLKKIFGFFLLYIGISFFKEGKKCSTRVLRHSKKQ